MTYEEAVEKIVQADWARDGYVTEATEATSRVEAHTLLQRLEALGLIKFDDKRDVSEMDLEDRIAEIIKRTYARDGYEDEGRSTVAAHDIMNLPMLTDGQRGDK